MFRHATVGKKTTWTSMFMKLERGGRVTYTLLGPKSLAV